MTDPFFDTSILVDWLLDRPQAVQELGRYARHRISRIVWTEVLTGEAPDRRGQVQALLDPFEIVEIDQRIALTAAEIRHRTRIKLLDAFILATALVNGGILITRNTKDFPANLPGIRVPYTL